MTNIRLLKSRNSREGKYIGKIFGRHVRINRYSKYKLMLTKGQK